MREQVDKLPSALELPGFRLLSPGAWGGMVVEYIECPEQVDLDPMFKGLPGDKCSCPHWGYMLKGAMHIEYADGTEEKIRPGDVCYMPAGHTGSIEAGSAMVLFSPEAEQKVIAEHFARKMQG